MTSKTRTAGSPSGSAVLPNNGYLINGLTIASTVSGRLLSAVQDRNNVTLVSRSQVNDHSIWTVGSGNIANAWFALRPLYNSNQNLNVFGGCDGTYVGTWDWDGGQPNEIWSLESID